MWIPNAHDLETNVGVIVMQALHKRGGWGGELHEVSSGPLLYVICRHLYGFGSFTFHVGHQQIMRASKCEVYSFTSHKRDPLEDELVLPLSLLQFDLSTRHERMILKSFKN